jgi:hypothetical protein
MSEKLYCALERIRKYVRIRKEMPLGGLGEIVHTIHAGTEYEAEISLEDLQTITAAPTPPSNADSGVSELVKAAQDVIERWDSPAWKDQPHTGEYINRIRQALANYRERKGE